MRDRTERQARTDTIETRDPLKNAENAHQQNDCFLVSDRETGQISSGCYEMPQQTMNSFSFYHNSARRNLGSSTNQSSPANAANPAENQPPQSPNPRQKTKSTIRQKCKRPTGDLGGEILSRLRLQNPVSAHLRNFFLSTAAAPRGPPSPARGPVSGGAFRTTKESAREEASRRMAGAILVPPPPPPLLLRTACSSRVEVVGGGASEGRPGGGGRGREERTAAPVTKRHSRLQRVIGRVYAKDKPVQKKTFVARAHGPVVCTVCAPPLPLSPAAL